MLFEVNLTGDGHTGALAELWVVLHAIVKSSTNTEGDSAASLALAAQQHGVPSGDESIPGWGYLLVKGCESFASLAMRSWFCGLHGACSSRRAFFCTRAKGRSTLTIHLSWDNVPMPPARYGNSRCLARDGCSAVGVTTEP